MKKPQILKFWLAVKESTKPQDAINHYKNQEGYDSERTLQRYARAYQGFENGVIVDKQMENTGWGLDRLEQLRGWFDELQDRKGTTQSLAGEPSEQPGPSNQLHHQAMRDMVEHIIKWVSDITEPIPLLSQGPSLQMLYGGQPLTASYRIEGEPAYQALEEHLRGGGLWQTFQRYQEYRWDYWSIQSDHQYLGNAGWIESEQAKLVVQREDRGRIWDELRETMYQVSMGFRGLMLVEKIPGECRWC